MAVERLDVDAASEDSNGHAEGRDLSLPPHSIQAEEAVLGSILKNPAAIVRVSDFLRPEDFYQQRNRHVYRAMLALFADGQPIDYHSTADRLQQLSLYEASGGLLYLSELNLATPSAAHIEHYGRIVERTSIMRQLIAKAQTIAEIAYRDNLDPDTALEKAEQLILSIAEKRVTRDFRSLEDVLTDYMEQIEALAEGEATRYGIPTGFIDLDKLLGGFQRTDLTILAARTSVGKTSFALNLAVNAALKHNATVAIFSLEMSAEQLASRLLSMESGIDSPRIRSGHLNEQENRKLDAAMNHLIKAPIWVDDTPSIPIMELRSKARRLAAEHSLDMIVVDYLQLIATEGGESRVQEIGQISRSLKALARELRVPVLALSQLSRAVEQRTPHIPQLSDLRESGCLTAETTLLRADTGAPISFAQLIEEGWQNVLVWSLDDRHRLTPARLTNVFRSGTRDVYRLLLASGRVVKATGNHRFMTFDGWVPLERLVPGGRIAVPRRLPEPARSGLGWSERRLGLLAHLIGDGCVLARQPCHYTSGDEANLHFVEEAARLEFGITGRRVRQGNWQHVYLPAPHRLRHGRHNPVVQWFRELGIAGLRSWEKRLPDKLYAASDSEVRTFLHHLWATDGSIVLGNGRTTHPKVYYATSSRALADGVMHLLARLAIPTRLYRARSPRSNRPSWHVVLAGTQAMRQFCAEVGVHGERGQCAAAYLASSSGRKGDTNVDTLPPEVWHVVKEERKRVGLTERQLQAAIGMAYCGSTLYRSCPSRQRLLRLAKALDSDVLRSAAASDVLWDRIVAIEPAGVEPVYDATVEGTRNFIANGIVAHNSIEQDADVVLFIYRDEKYNPDTDKKGVADIIVAKHRNGPTGQVQLLFLERTTKFLDLEVFRA